jgi:hypothetical protein
MMQEKKIENKGSQMGQTKKIFKKIEVWSFYMLMNFLFPRRFGSIVCLV